MVFDIRAGRSTAYFDERSGNKSLHHLLSLTEDVEAVAFLETDYFWKLKPFGSFSVLCS